MNRFHYAELLARLERGERRLLAQIQRYDRPGPRYTSYPTSPQFSPDFGAADYERCLERAADGSSSARPLGVYLHIPFCERRCDYCGCHVVPTAKKSVGRTYAGFLRREIELLAARLGRRRKVRVLHFGGGTPTYLGSEDLSELIAQLEACFDFDPQAERSIEIDPRVTSAASLQTLRRLGFDRLSFGVQDFSPEVQAAIGRFQGREETTALFIAARELGFDGLNFDLVYGLPLQDELSLRQTIDEVLFCRPDRIALYSFAHVPALRRQQRSIDAATLPRGAKKLALFLGAAAALTDAGYEPAGMDHFAQAQDDLALAARGGRLGRSFMGYGPHRELEVLGLGVSAISDLGGGYAQNEKKLAPYYRAVERGELPTERGLLRQPEDEPRRWVIERLLCDFRIRAQEFHTRFGTPFGEAFASEMRAAAPLAADGLVELDGEDLLVSSAGRLFVRNVAMVFDQYLERQATAAGRFSRTV